MAPRLTGGNGGTDPPRLSGTGSRSGPSAGKGTGNARPCPETRCYQKKTRDQFGSERFINELKSKTSPSAAGAVPRRSLSFSGPCGGENGGEAAAPCVSELPGRARALSRRVRVGPADATAGTEDFAPVAAFPPHITDPDTGPPGPAKNGRIIPISPAPL